MDRTIRNDFPFLVKNPDVIYFDSAATSLKPKVVIDEVVNYYENLSANVHRGDYETANETSRLFDEARIKTAKFLNAKKENIVFTSGASESLNLLATGLGSVILEKDDIILLNEAEHASNILPWYQVAKDTGAKIEFIPIPESGLISLESIESAMHNRVKIVAMAHVSNVLGNINDLKSIAHIVHQYGAYLCVDGAQAIGHIAVDVQETDIDFYAFSAHKMFGPSGVGVLYGKKHLLEIMKPLNYGGGSNARFNVCGDVSLKEVPYRFESGTPNIEGVLGFSKAIDYLQAIGYKAIQEHEAILHAHLLDALKKMDHIKIYNENADTGIVTFNVEGIFSQDVAAYLNRHNMCLRSGNHCSKLISGAIKTENSLRLSLYVYNTLEEVDKFIEIIKDVTIEKTIDTYL